MSFLSSLLNALPGAVAQGLIWGLMAIGVYITFRILDVADLTVDGSLATGGAVAVMLIRALGYGPIAGLAEDDPLPFRDVSELFQQIGNENYIIHYAAKTNILNTCFDFKCTRNGSTNSGF